MLHRCRLILVDIDSRELHFRAVVASDLVDDRIHLTTRPAPRCPELHESRLISFEHFLLESLISYFHNAHNRDPYSSMIETDAFRMKGSSVYRSAGFRQDCQVLRSSVLWFRQENFHSERRSDDRCPQRVHHRCRLQRICGGDLYREGSNENRQVDSMSAQSPLHVRILIVGGGAGGLSVAARLRRSHEQGIVVVEPSDVNYYQPAWSLVGAGIMPVSSTVKPEAQVMPRGVSWVRSSVTHVDPHRREVSLANGDRITYEALVLAAGIELHWDGLPGLAEAMATDRVSSNYSFDYAEKTWSILRRITSGTVVFSRASGLVKCPSAAQKIMYLAADHWRKKGCLDKIRIVFVTPGQRIYDKDEFS